MACYTDDQEFQKALKASGNSINETLSSFLAGTHSILKNSSKIPFVWEELVLNHDVGLSTSKEALVAVWQSSANVAAVVAKGLKWVVALVS